MTKCGILTYLHYDAYGGFNYLHKTFDSLEELKSYLKKNFSRLCFENLQVVDITTLDMILVFDYDELYNRSREMYGERIEVNPLPESCTNFRGTEIGPDNNTCEVRSLNVSVKDFFLEQLETLSD